MLTCPAEQAHKRLTRPSQIEIELREEMLRDRQLGIERERTPERLLGKCPAFTLVTRAVLCHQPVHATEPRPCRRVVRIAANRFETQVARRVPRAAVFA